MGLQMLELKISDSGQNSPKKGSLYDREVQSAPW